MDYKKHISQDLALLLEDMGNIYRTYFFWDKVFIDADKPGERPRGEFAQYAQWSMLTTATLHFFGLCGDQQSFTARGATRNNLTLERIALPLVGHAQWGAWIKKELNEVLGFARSPEFVRLRHRVISHFDFATRTGADPYPNFPIDSLRRAVEDAADCARYCLAAELFDKGIEPDASEIWWPQRECAKLRGQARRVQEALIGVEHE